MDDPADPPRVERRRTNQPHPPSHRQWTPLGRGLLIAGDSWTLAIVAELAAGRARLTDLRERLAGVSAGVLDRRLRRMASAGLIRRVRFRELPPRVELELTDAGRELIGVAESLAVWGRRWAWTEPLAGEIVDPGALLRSLPTLIAGPVKARDGVVELILDERGGRRRHLARIAGGRVTMLGGAGRPAGAGAAVCGDWLGWTAFLGVERDASLLEISGNRSLALGLLSAIARPRAASSLPASAIAGGA